jgi:hypothetical protein
MLASNYYACLSPPPCQVEEHKQETKQVTFKTTMEISPSTPAATRNKIRARWDQIVKKRQKENNATTQTKGLPQQQQPT